MPAKNRKDLDILFIYGHHSSLERWWGLVKHLSRYGSVTMPDLPGFGGMESFYRLGKKPSVDNLADYLAAFMKMHFKRKNVVVVGLSFGFVVVTRMLQRYPELTKNIKLIVSLAGFTHADDFVFTKRRRLIYKFSAELMSYNLTAFAFRYICLNKPFLRLYYQQVNQPNGPSSRKSNLNDRTIQTAAEIWLWQHNDLRTHASTSAEFLSLDNCRKFIELPVWNVIADTDPYFDYQRVAQHMSIVFTDVRTVKSKLRSHAPSLVANEQEAAELVPPQLRRTLRQL